MQHEPVRGNNDDKRCPEWHQWLSREEEVQVRQGDKDRPQPAGLHGSVEERQQAFTPAHNCARFVGGKFAQASLDSPLQGIPPSIFVRWLHESLPFRRSRRLPLDMLQLYDRCERVSTIVPCIPPVILSEAKNLARRTRRFFAAAFGERARP